MAKKPENPMPEEVRRELFKLRCKSKEGRGLTDYELDQCQKWLKKYPTQYKAMDEEVREATKPFGAF